ncbi:hypothetical protein [Prosthecobacter sp.]|uniref:hypothetical protein n=1 Tax=Prosthecobacter sp. TaxID=1965333 RepID=UPI003782F98A
MTSSSQRLTLLLLGLALLTSAPAQDPAPANPPTPAPVAAPTPAPPPPPDPKILRETEAILKDRFSRDPNDLLRHIERVGTTDPATLPVNDRFQFRFVTSDWPKIREELALMPPDLARKIYDKMLVDLTDRQRPNIRLEDVLGLADSAPGELTGDNLRRLGQLTSIAVPVAENYWLVDRLKKGTAKLGGTDPAKRLAAARLLIYANFKDLARTYLPSPAEMDQIADEGLKNELRNFLTTQQERENAQHAEVQRIWDENINALLNPDTSKAKAWEKSKAGNNISKVITQVPTSTLASVLAEAAKTNPQGAMHLVTAFTRKVQNDRNGDVTSRAENLAAQSTIASLLLDLVPSGEQPWSQIFEMMADHWTSEADYTYQQKSTNNNQGRYVAPEELLAVAPAGKWAAALTTSVRDRIDVAMSRLILTGAQFDQAAERIVEIGKRSPTAGAALAEDFLTVWGKTHNPQLPEQLRRKYGLPDDARIPVTPIMMEKNIDSLARMMTLFRNAGLAPKDYASVVAAFDLAYSTAETYRTSHIEKVFGPMDKMDEPVFSLILAKMNSNLGERWRKMDVQRAGLTQRDEGQTLDMVRSGYDTALKLIDAWLKGHAGSWRAPMLAGTLCVDWGDFEYFQQLVVADPQKRMFAFKEKNVMAQDYFDRACTAYAATVPKLSPSDYTVEPHMAWFNGLLGIGSNNQLNLSKAMNRAALTKIRDHLTALPGKAAKDHISLFAKIINTRLNDEKDPLHEDLEYRYIASAMIITKDDPFTLGAAKKLTYFDELLSEVRLQTRVDGPNTVGRDQDFGIIVSIIHTEAMTRAAKFGQYLTNDLNPGPNQGKKNSPLVKKMVETQGPRDELELNITQALAPFFDIKSITFSTPEVKPRPTAKPGWEETVLAYLHVRAKDASVDKIPPVELALKFVDMTGPVSIPAESAETIIKVSSDPVPPRPASHIEITQTLDNRQLPINGALTLEIKATSTGLTPDLDQLLTFDPKAVISVKHTNPHEGLQIKELNSWGDEVTPTSERLWTLTLDGDAVRAAETPLTFHFPTAKAKDATMTLQTYKDMNLTTLTDPAVTLGMKSTPADIVTHPTQHPTQWLAIIATGIIIAIGFAFLLFRKRAPDPSQATRVTFHMPAEVDAFSVVALLRRLRTSPQVKLKDSQKQELQSDLTRIEQQCFTPTPSIPESDLRTIATKWLRCAS